MSIDDEHFGANRTIDPAGRFGRRAARRTARVNRGGAAAGAACRVAAALAFGFSGLASADPLGPQAKATVVFDIPEQPLTTALQAYSAASGIAVLYRSNIDGALRSVEVHGEHTRDAALRALLGNSGLLVRYARADAITLADPSAAPPDGPPNSVLGDVDMALDTLHIAASRPEAPDGAALSDYFSAIQQEIQLTLKRTRIAPGIGYRLEVDLWVDPSRTIRRAEVIHSTGDHARDVAVSTALQGLIIRRPPPAGVANPVRVKILVSGA